jgi:hypothetical protein
MAKPVISQEKNNNNIVWERTGILFNVLATLGSLFIVLLTYGTLKVTKSTLIEMQNQNKLTQETLNEMQRQSNTMEYQGKLSNATLKEMQTQRIKSYEPELVIEPNVPIQFYARINERTIEIYTFNTETDTNHVGFIKDVPFGFYQRTEPNDCKIPLINIGLGVAKNINLRWSFDTIAFLNFYNDTLKLFDFIKSITTNNNKIYINDTRIDNTKVVTFIKFISSNEQDNSQSFTLPEIYIKLWSLMEFCSVHSVGTDKMKYTFNHYRPPLYLSIDYMDVNNKKYYKKFKIIINKIAPYTMYSGFNLLINNGYLTFLEMK